MLHHGSYPEEGHESSEEEQGSDAQVDAEGEQEEHSQGVGVQLTYEADSAQDVTWRRGEEEDNKTFIINWSTV